MRKLLASNVEHKLDDLLFEEDDLSTYDIYVWGTGNTTTLYQQGFKRLEREGFCIQGYVDNDCQKWGKIYEGKVILSPKAVSNLDNVLVLISTPQPDIVKLISMQLEEMNVKWRHIDSYILKKHSNEVKQVYDLFDDERSRDIYEKLLTCHINGLYPGDDVVSHEQYFSFSNFGEYNAREFFVDCGAFVGDSLEKFIWAKDGIFEKIIAFEPDYKNFTAMKNRLRRLRMEWNINEQQIEIYPYAVGRHTGSISVEHYEKNNGFGTKIRESSNSEEDAGKIVSLDDFIKDSVTFLKADIESYEYEMLMGAQKIIKEQSPKLAICIYHNSVDFYQIPLLLKELQPKYKLAVRHYTHMLSETVLYAYVD